MNKLIKLPFANSSHPRTPAEQEEIINAAAAAYEKYLDALGFDWRSDPNSTNTPRRVAKAFVKDLAAGCYNTPPSITSFPSQGYTGMVFEGCIPVKSMCSHHHLPFTGVAHVAYIPTTDVIGLSKMNRIVEFFSRRPQIQEGLTNQIHTSLDEICKNNKGVAVVICATHSCACNRGIKHDGCVMKTSKLSGDFMLDAATRSEFYAFISTLKGI